MEKNQSGELPPPPPPPHHRQEQVESMALQSPCFPSIASKIQKKTAATEPSLPSNDWGGASPLLSHNIPRESLQIAYEKLDDTIRAIDGLQAAASYLAPKPIQEKEMAEEQNNGKKEKTESGSKKWFRLPKLDPKNRWPQGWC